MCSSHCKVMLGRVGWHTVPTPLKYFCLLHCALSEGAGVKLGPMLIPQRLGRLSMELRRQADVKSSMVATALSLSRLLSPFWLVPSCCLALVRTSACGGAH